MKCLYLVLSSCKNLSGKIGARVAVIWCVMCVMYWKYCCRPNTTRRDRKQKWVKTLWPQITIKQVMTLMFRFSNGLFNQSFATQNYLARLTLFVPHVLNMGFKVP